MSRTMLTRRKLLKIGAAAGAGLVLPMDLKWFGRGSSFAFSQTTPNLTKFVRPLPGLDFTGTATNGIPVAAPDQETFQGADYYKIVMGQYKQLMHPDLPGETTLWGYADVTFGQTPNHRYLGGLIVANKGTPARITAINNLPSTHPLPVDQSPEYMMGAMTENRASVHLHGGFVPWISDGGPFAWFDPNGSYGVSAESGGSFYSVPDMPEHNPGIPDPGTFNYYYPNQQSARLMWYHDHAHGITRLNAYVGLATGYLLLDEIETGLMTNNVLPPLGRTIPLVIQDKSFIGPLSQRDPGGRGGLGDLWYPSVYEKASLATGRWDYGPDLPPPFTAVLPDPAHYILPVPSGVPEFFADTPVINGMCYPYLEVEPRHYRFLILNGSQARFYNLQLYYASNTNNAEVDLLPDHSGNLDLTKVRVGPNMVQIGSECGFLPFPVALNRKPMPLVFNAVTGNPVSYNLLLAPAERADIIIDFSNVPVGAKLILYSDAPAPFPGGDPRVDYFTGAPDWRTIGGAASTVAGFGPNTRTLMQIRVKARTGAADPASMGLLEKLALGTASPTLNPLPQVARLSSRGAAMRNLTLNEDFDDFGRLIQRIGTDVQNGMNNQNLPTWARNYMDQATETPAIGATEVWRIFNLTGDAHPIHFHLVNVQVLARQPFDVGKYDGTPVFTGPARGPDANERGWKETVRMNPGECTTVIMKFDLPQVPSEWGGIPLSPRTGGHEYVWHCHILEHEEHDMMRPLIVG